MKPPPPILPARGYVTAIANPVATAAPTALPPLLSTSAPIRSAIFSCATTMPWRADTGCACVGSDETRASCADPMEGRRISSRARAKRFKRQLSCFERSSNGDNRDELIYKMTRRQTYPPAAFPPTNMKVKMTSLAPAPERTYPPRSAVIGWIFFDWAAQPYFTLITTFVFAHYFATRIAPDPATGQSLWGFATSIAGFLIAFLSPVMGAIADAGGRRKPWIAAFGALLVIGSSMMWIGKPGDPSVIVPVLIAFGIATIGAEFATVFNNAMMPYLVPPEKIGRLSGTGWATGYVGGIVSLVLVLGFLAANEATGRTLFGLTPLFGLDPVSHQGDRITGPLTAVWFVIFVLPLFMLTPDYTEKRPIGAALREGLSGLRRTLGELPKQKRVATFLLANMIYIDGLVSLFAGGGIYAAGTFGWQTIQIGSFGFLLVVCGSFGVWFGGL